MVTDQRISITPLLAIGPTTTSQVGGYVSRPEGPAGDHQPNSSIERGLDGFLETVMKVLLLAVVAER